MNIQRLSETEKDLAIQKIVKKGIITSGDRFRKIMDIKRVCTFRTLFFGVGDCLFIGLLIAVCLWMLLMQADPQVIIGIIFTISPFAYITLYALTTWKEHVIQLYEVKMTCRYTFRQISAIRMMYFSGINMILNVLMLSWLLTFKLSFVLFWKAMGLSFAAVFLYGVIMLIFRIKGKPYLTAAFPPALWVTVNALVIAFYGEQMEQMLLDLAGVLVFIIAVVMCVIYFAVLFHFFVSRTGEE